ncbi:MAG: phosphoadenosine phosphosulfate reductase family protein, partial [Cytophagales bacterium]|nr:phosphoadenosine phosphosulfate reductase family protein [Cytophagales bacterium]
VLLHLVREFDPNKKVIIFCYEKTELLDNYEETIAKWQGLNLEKIFVDLPIISSFTERDFIPQWALENGYHAGFVGLRKEESRARFLTLAKYGAYYECANGLVRICPLMDWKTRDVATYILQNDIPTLNTYKVTGFNTRTTNSVVSEKAHIISKQLTILKKVDIKRYYELLNKYPELRNFV